MFSVYSFVFRVEIFEKDHYYSFIVFDSMLSGKWSLVTGAGRGIGRAIALALAKEESSLALTARSQDQVWFG